LRWRRDPMFGLSECCYRQNQKQRAETQVSHGRSTADVRLRRLTLACSGGTQPLGRSHYKVVNDPMTTQRQLILTVSFSCFPTPDKLSHELSLTWALVSHANTEHTICRGEAGLCVRRA
jgi:hypothetical protein